MNPHEATTTYKALGGGQVDRSDILQEKASEMGPLDRILTTIEKREILDALKRASGQRTLAARLLGISRSRLYRRMEALDIDPRDTGAFREVRPRGDE
jgi:DNA-binding NtrC family response regulator